LARIDRQTVSQSAAFPQFALLSVAKKPNKTVFFSSGERPFWRACLPYGDVIPPATLDACGWD
ncbi:MAG: hypothetical protein ACPGYL_04805, partial [Rhodospirillaceae bacterium]